MSDEMVRGRVGEGVWGSMMMGGMVKGPLEGMKDV